MTETAKSYPLGLGNGSLFEFSDGTVAYRESGKIIPAFRVSIRDVTGLSMRRAKKDERENGLGIFTFGGLRSLQQVLAFRGSGTTIAEVVVSVDAARQIETWFRAHPLFGAGPAPRSADPVGRSSSLSDELRELAGLRDAGILSPEEFERAKNHLLG